MKFDKNSGMVQLYVRLIQSGAYNLDMVPAMGNLREAVHDVLHELAEEQTA